MDGPVSNMLSTGEPGVAKVLGAAPRFHHPSFHHGIMVDEEGTIVANSHRLRKSVGQQRTVNHRPRVKELIDIVGGQVMTLADSSEASKANGTGAGARFNKPLHLGLLESRRCLVVEDDRTDSLPKDSLWKDWTTRSMVGTSLALPLWISPVEEAAAVAPDEAKIAALSALQDYGKLVENSEMADVMLLVEGHRFPAHRAILAARSEFFRGLFKSGLQEASCVSLGQDEFELWEISASVFRVLLRYLYMAQMPEGKETRVSGAESCAGGNGGKGDQKGEGSMGIGGGVGKGKGGEVCMDGEGEDSARRQTVERELFKVADLFQVEGWLKHCLEIFQQSLTLRTAVEHLVWAYLHGPHEACILAAAYVVQHFKAIQVFEAVSAILHLSVSVFFVVYVYVSVFVVSVTVCRSACLHLCLVQRIVCINTPFFCPLLLSGVYTYLQRKKQETLGSIIIISALEHIFRLNILIFTHTQTRTHSHIRMRTHLHKHTPVSIIISALETKFDWNILISTLTHTHTHACTQTYALHNYTNTHPYARSHTHVH